MTEKAPDGVTITLEAAHELAAGVLRANGCSPPVARAVADVMIAAEADRCASHGLFRLSGYVASLRSGKVDGTAVPTVETLAPGLIRVDALGGFAPPALIAGQMPLVEAAKAQGIAALSIRNCYHFAALWPEVEAIAAHGLAAFAFTAATPMVAPYGGTKPFFGTNPMAFAFPRRDGPPIAFDQASAAMARGDVMIHARDGEPVPEGVGLDAEGRPTTDPNEILKGGAQLTFGGHKGTTIALMIELLAGALIGDIFSFEAGRIPRDGGPPVGGELMIAIDPARFTDGGEGWRDRAEELIAELLSQPGVRLPGQRRHKARAETPNSGIVVPTALHAQILELVDTPAA